MFSILVQDHHCCLAIYLLQSQRVSGAIISIWDQIIKWLLSIKNIKEKLEGRSTRPSRKPNKKMKRKSKERMKIALTFLFSFTVNQGLKRKTQSKVWQKE